MKWIASLLFLLIMSACDPEIYKSVTGPVATPALSNEEVIRGLKEALSLGARNSVLVAGLENGFYKNPRLFIPFPKEALEMKEKLVRFGFSRQVEEFELSLNRAAEEAVKKAAPVFIDAISHMSVHDGFKILRGGDTAATNYLRLSTYGALRDQFSPVVTEAVGRVKVTSYWNPLISAYNIIPGVKKQNPDLEGYITDKAIQGLMLLIADEEIRIRKNPAARITELLKKVFGSVG